MPSFAFRSREGPDVEWLRLFGRIGRNWSTPITVVLFLSTGLTSYGQDDPGRAPANPIPAAGLAAGTMVVLKAPEIPLHGDSGERPVSADEAAGLKVERVAGDHVFVVSPESRRRGWIGVDQVLPLDLAMDYFDRTIAQDPRDIDSYRMRSQLWNDRKDYDRALADLDQAIRLAPDRATAYVDRGSVLALGKQEVDRGLTDLNRAIELAPKMALAYRTRALIWGEKPDRPRMKSDLDTAIQLDPSDARAWFLRQVYWFQEGNAEKALADIDQVIRLDPDSTRAYQYRGSIRAQKTGDLDKAIADFSEAIRLDPKDTWTYEQRAAARERNGDFAEAIEDYSEIIRLEPNNAAARSNRASVRMKKHDPRNAIADYTAAIALEPKNPAHFIARGYAWSRQGEHAEAIANFDEGIRLDPNGARGYTARAAEWEKDLKSDKALADYQTAIALDPKAVPAYEGRGRVWRKRAEYTNAVFNFAELARVLPDEPLGHRELAWLIATCDDDAIRDGRRALAEATTACELTKWSDPDCLEALAAACAEVKDFAAAVKWQTRAIEIFTAGNDRADRRLITKKRQNAEMGHRLYCYKRRLPYHEKPERSGR
jgi:tetratricopeptide (TPR) repeat protein